MKIPKVLSVCFVLCCLFVGNVFAVSDEGCIEITKEADRACSQVGDTILYTITIQNCGFGELLVLSVEDSLLGPLDGLCPFLLPDEICVLEVPYTVQEGDPDLLVNEVTVTALDLFIGQILTGTAATEVMLVNPDFTLDVECINEPDGLVNGNSGYAMFQVCISNIGNVPLDIQADCFTNDLLSSFPTLEPDQEVCVLVEVPLEGAGPCGTGGFAELTCCVTATIPPDYCDLPNVIERCDTDICETPPCEQTLAVDIKPTSCPNPLRARGKGVLPVAILGTEDFDVNAIDVLTITLAGVSPIRSNYEDVATPLDKEDECECHDAGPDGFTDLTLKFDKRKIVEALGDLSLLPRRSVIPLTLRGKLMDDDILILEGTDCIVFLNLRQR